MRRAVLTNVDISIDNSNNSSLSYVYRTYRTSSGYDITTSKNESYKYNDVNKYIFNNKYQEMPETMTWNSITTNDGLVVAYSGNTAVIYDLFPNNSLTSTNIDAIKMQNSITFTPDFIKRNAGTYHSVVCKSSSGNLSPQCNILVSGSSVNYGTIDMDLPESYTKPAENDTVDEYYKKHGLYSFSSNNLDSFWIKAKPYLYISASGHTLSPSRITPNVSFIKCTDNIYYIANITDEKYINFTVTTNNNSDCIVEFM